MLIAAVSMRAGTLVKMIMDDGGFFYAVPTENSDMCLIKDADVGEFAIINETDNIISNNNHHNS